MPASDGAGLDVEAGILVFAKTISRFDPIPTEA
jgi:hypothetical protein